MNENILDSEINIEEFSFHEILYWWEKRRLLFNFVVVIIQLGLMGAMWKETQEFGLSAAFWGSLGHLLVANILFSIGWGIEFISIYYLNTNKFLIRFRSLFYVLGVLFAMLITFYFYYYSLLFYSW